MDTALLAIIASVLGALLSYLYLKRSRQDTTRPIIRPELKYAVLTGGGVEVPRIWPSLTLRNWSNTAPAVNIVTAVHVIEPLSIWQTLRVRINPERSLLKRWPVVPTLDPREVHETDVDSHGGWENRLCQIVPHVMKRVEVNIGLTRAHYHMRKRRDIILRLTATCTSGITGKICHSSTDWVLHAEDGKGQAYPQILGWTITERMPQRRLRRVFSRLAGQLS